MDQTTEKEDEKYDLVPINDKSFSSDQPNTSVISNGVADNGMEHQEQPLKFKTSTISGYTFTQDLAFEEISSVFEAKNISAFEFLRTKYYGVAPEDDRIGEGQKNYIRCFVYKHCSNATESILIFWTDIGVVETILPDVWILLCSQGYNI